MGTVSISYYFLVLIFAFILAIYFLPGYWKLLPFFLLGSLFLIILLYKSLPKKLPPHLTARTNFPFTTKLKNFSSKPECQSLIGTKAMLRIVRDSKQIFVHPDLDEPRVSEGNNFGLTYILIDGCFGVDEPTVLVGRSRDRGSGDFGWHVLLVKKSKSEIDITKHQRYEYWHEEKAPDQISLHGSPIHLNNKKFRFYNGTADLIGDEFYEKYMEPEEQDR